jgi:hypothetical protein
LLILGSLRVCILKHISQSLHRKEETKGRR